MKRFFLVAGFLAALSPASAQHKHSSNHNKSVFRNVHQGRNIAAIKKTNDKIQAAFPQWSVNADKATGNVKDIYGPAISLAGANNLERAQNCINQKLGDLGINANEWVLTRNLQTDKAGWVDFQQVVNGRKVAFSKMSFRFTTDGKLVRLNLKYYGQPDNSTTAGVSAEQALDNAVQDLTGVAIDNKQIDGDWIWFPVPTESGYALHPSWVFNINGTDSEREPMQLRGYVDATDGKVLYRVNDVKHDYDLTVKGMVNVNGINQAATLEPLANLKLTVNGNSNNYTDDQGFFSSLTYSIPDLTTIALEGKWSRVRNSPTSNSVPTLQENVTLPGTSFTYHTSGVAQSQHINAYYHVNKVHDYMKSHYPTFTGLDIALNTNIDLTSSTCNAFYNGSSINFYAEGGGCNSFAKIGDIVYHEYGHGINDKFYNAQGANTMDNGALNEGYADVWGMSITHNPILGQGTIIGGGGLIRRYDLAPKVYPQDIEGEVHADGEIIAGAWWDVAENLNDVDTMAKLFALTLFDTPDGPDGTEGDVYHQVLISALLNDDDDNNINNGTPHFMEIVEGFREHGIFLLSDASLDHDDIFNQVDGQPIPITATLQISYTPFLKNLELVYRQRGSTWNTINMTNTGNMVFAANIPSQPVGAIVDYYFVVTDTFDTPNAYFPEGFTPAMNNQSNIPHQFGVSVLQPIVENFEGTLDGWVVGNFTGHSNLYTDNATAGKWVHAVPVPSTAGGLLSQTGNDHTSGSGKCLVTGNASSAGQGAGAADVDNGRTSVLTPAFDISGFTNPMIEYHRWFSNNRGQNPGTEAWEVRIGVDNGNVWPLVEQTYVSDQRWRKRIFKVRDYVPTGDNIRLYFSANDRTDNGGCILEAGIDDFVIHDNGFPTGIANTEVEKASIYPNPANEQIFISLPVSYSSGSVSLYDLSGKQLSSIPLKGGQKEYRLNTQHLPAGSYFVLIQAEKFIQSQKVNVLH